MALLREATAISTFFHQAVAPDDFLIRVQELVAAEL